MTGLRGRLFTLAGVFPLGAFLLEHLVLAASSLGGPAPFARTARVLLAPGLLAVEAVVVGVPLAFHAAYGIYLVAKRRALREPSPYVPATLAVVRWSGVVVFVYLMLHVYELRVATAVDAGRAELLYSRLAEQLSATSGGIPWRALAALVGLSATVAHFAAGLWGYLVGAHGWGARRVTAGLAVGAGLYMLVGVSALVGLATGGHPFVTPAESGPNAGVPCPAGSP